VNGLRAQVDDYLRVRRALGFKLAEHERFLTQFMDYLDQVHATTITVEYALTWARLPVGAGPGWHAVRLSAVRGFAAWARTFDPAVQVPPARMLPFRTTRATPYLYTASEINALMDTATSLHPPLRAATIQTLIGLLAVTGMRAGEAVGADVSDLNLNTGALTVRGAKFGKSRLLPLHPSTTDALGAYLRVRAHHGATTAALLVSTAGTRLTYALMESIIGLFKTEAIRPGPFHTGPLKNLADVEFTTMAWVDWFNHRRLHSTLGMLTPAEAAHYAATTALQPEPQPV